MQKVLIITYYWPNAGGPGVQRWLKFVKYFNEFGIEPIVYCPENADYPFIDKTLSKEIPENTIVISQPIKELYQYIKWISPKKTRQIQKGIIPNAKKQSTIEKLMLWARGNLCIPDARFVWIKPSIKFLKEYIKKNPVDAIITTGPPHSIHLIGLQLQEKLKNISWIADFRDPWTSIGYHRDLKLSKWAKQKHLKLEKSVLDKADCITVTSQGTKTKLQSISQTPIEVITNGYDNDKIHKETKDELDLEFSITHIGSMLSSRNPEILWNTLQNICNRNPLFKEKLRLQFVGVLSSDVLESIKKSGLEKNVEYIGYVTHQKARKIQYRSQILLLVEIDHKDNSCIIPGKFFEYLESQRPILAFGHQEADIKTLIQQTESGAFFNYQEQQNKIEKQIETHFTQFIEKKDARLKQKLKDFSKFSRRELTKKMSKLIKNTIKTK